MVEDEYFIVLRPKLLKGLGSIKFVHNNLFKHFPENCRPASHTLIWVSTTLVACEHCAEHWCEQGSVFSRSVLRVAAFNSTSVHVLLRGRRTWKLFPPSQSKYLHLEPDGVLSGLTLQVHCLRLTLNNSIVCWFSFMRMRRLWMRSCQTPSGTHNSTSPRPWCLSSERARYARPVPLQPT